MVPQVAAVVDGLRKESAPSGNKSVAGVVSLLLACLICVPAFAQTTEPEAAFSAANRLYEQGKFSEAADAYDKLIQSGVSSFALHFNAGNAWFKAGRPGRAILAYRKAERLAPRDASVNANLRFVRSQIGTSNPPTSGGGFVRLLEGITLNEWSVLAGGAITLLFLYLGVGQLLPKTKERPRWIVWVLSAVAAGLVIGCALVARVQLGDKIVVVTASETVVRRGPFAESPTVFVARDGMELMAQGVVNEWLEVADASGHTGWVPRADVSDAK
jgi:tetratricopeptide (TPR) repeat protein